MSFVLEWVVRSTRELSSLSGNEREEGHGLDSCFEELRFAAQHIDYLINYKLS